MRSAKIKYLRNYQTHWRLPSHRDEMAGASGFDNSANTLFLQTSLMSRYIAAAERVVSTLMPDTTANTKLLAVRKRMIVAYPSAETTALEAAQRVLQQLLLRAYRRPSTPDEIQRYLLLFDSVYRADSTLKGYELAIKQCIQAVLISPKFLFRNKNLGEMRTAWMHCLMASS